MDVLAAVMRELQFAAAGYRVLDLSAPWAISFGQSGMRGIHLVTEGRCEVVFGRGKAQLLEAGDLVIAPRADPHVLRSIGPRAAVTPAGQLLSAHGRIRHGGRGETAKIVCGAFAFVDGDHPALSGFPHVMLVRGEGGLPPRWMRGYVDALLAEIADEGPGSAVVLARLSAAIVTRALRHSMESETGDTGWLNGLRDPGVAKALAAMHEESSKAWTIEALARVAGLSRAAFAARFHDRVGETPMRYLFQRRMRQAAAMLRDQRKTLAQVAEAVGYQSEAALSAAFKRHAGVSPGEFRRTAEEAPRPRAVRAAGK